MFTDDTVLHKQVLLLQDAENLQGGDFLQERKEVYVCVCVCCVCVCVCVCVCMRACVCVWI